MDEQDCPSCGEDLNQLSEAEKADVSGEHHSEWTAACPNSDCAVGTVV